jgi:hypothetical protein
MDFIYSIGGIAHERYKDAVFFTPHIYNYGCLPVLATVLYPNRRATSEAIPLQAWAGPEGSRSLMLPDFKTIST